MIWYMHENPEIVISTRVRLARNIEGVPFPEKLLNKHIYIQKIKDAIFKSNSTLAEDFEDICLADLTQNEKLSLVEKHLISLQMLKSTEGDCLVSKNKTMSIMIMEEDHIREQVIFGGYKPEEAYEMCNKIDDVLSENLNLAFDEKLGYLTACPTNVGTGMRLSVMLHLPALTLTGKIRDIVNSASNIGIAVRGYNGEGTQAEGSFYQISNQITMGISEQEIVDRVKNVTDSIIAYEKEERNILLKKNRNELEDRVWRAYGALKYSRIITSKEAIAKLSDVLLGINMGIITETTKVPVMEMIVNCQPANVSYSQITSVERDIKRANYIRENI